MTTCQCDDYQPAIAQPKLRAQLLATGRVNARASDLLDEVRNTLTTMIRGLCEARGIEPDLTNPTNTELCVWLHVHSQAIACDEGAGEDLRQLLKHQRQIERVVDLRVPQRFVGPCPSVLDGGRTCEAELTAKREATEVVCPSCKTRHDVEYVFKQWVDSADGLAFTQYELVGDNKSGDWHGMMGRMDEYVSPSTFNRWRRERRIHAEGFDEPARYLLGNVRRLRDEMGANQAMTRFGS